MPVGRQLDSQLASASALPHSFFLRDPRQVAPGLLGKLLLRRSRGSLLAGRIVEAEAYLGTGDDAAHAAAGLTPRNRVLFGPPGHAYVYFIYGNHYCLNVSCLPEGEAGCVLIRALEPVAGLRQMARARGLRLAGCTLLEAHPLLLRNLASGPGRLCQALGITRERDNGRDLTTSRSGLWLADDNAVPPRVVVTPRIGIRSSAGEMLRYVAAGNPFVSGRRAA